MYYKNALRLLLEMVHPIQKSLLIRMTAYACQLLDMRVDGNCLAKQAYLFSPSMIFLPSVPIA